MIIIGYKELIVMTSKKRGLGKGLSALIGERPSTDTSQEEGKPTENTIQRIKIDEIVTKADQPRKDFDKDSLEDLSKSIKKHGVIQPILLRKLEDKYEIVAGERRYRASKLALLKEIPSIIVDADDEDASKLALIENIQREDLNPIEEAMGYKQLMDEFQLKQEELATAIGKSRSYITNAVRLLNLDERIIELLYKDQLTTGHGKVLLGIKDKEEQFELARKVIEKGLNVRETESEVKKTKSEGSKKRKKKRTRSKDPYMLDLEDELMRALGTKVQFIPGKKVNKIEIEYYGNEDLERILETIID